MNHSSPPIALLIDFFRRSSVALILFALLGCSAASRRVQPQLAPLLATNETRRMEHHMLQLLNEDRARAGLKPLTQDDQLSNIARSHSSDMMSRGFFGHESPSTGSPQDRIERAGVVVLESRENVAQAPSSTVAQSSLMASKGHRANVLASSVTHVGIGIVRDVDRPKQATNFFFTQLFALPAKQVDSTTANELAVRFINKTRKSHQLVGLTRSTELEQLAKRYVNDLQPDHTESSLSRIGNEIQQHATTGPGERRILSASAQILLDIRQLAPTPSLLDRRFTTIGIASAHAMTRNKRPVLKVLLVMSNR